MESYTVSKKLHKLTAISVTINTDGIHSEDALVGYIAEDPFVVLCTWVDRYIISYYNQKIYPVGYCSFPYTIKIKDIGSIYEPSNLGSKVYYRDIESFENMNRIMNTVILTNENRDEYYRLLSASLESIPDLQKAIDSQDIVKSIYGSYKDDNDRVQNMLGILRDHTYGEDYKMDLLMSYVAKRSIEKSYEAEFEADII